MTTRRDSRRARPSESSQRRAASLVIDLGELPEEGLHVYVHRTPAALDWAEQDRALLAGELSAELGVERIEGGWVVDGWLRTEVELACARCLRRFPRAVDEGIRVVCMPYPKGGFPEEVELSQEDLGVTFVRERKLDLSELLRQEVILALPVKPLCAEDCRGLCPRCGRNRNVDTCDCEERTIDPRWEVLRALKLS